MNDTLEQRTECAKASWNDFTLEEHLSAFVQRQFGELMVIKPVWKGMYRINLINMGTRSIRSAMVKVIETPEGYIMERKGS